MSSSTLTLTVAERRGKKARLLRKSFTSDEIPTVSLYKKKEPAKKEPAAQWGRSNGRTTLDAIGAAVMIFFTPTLTFYCWTACTHYSCAASGPIMKIYTLISTPTEPFCALISVKHSIQAALLLKDVGLMQTCNGATRLLSSALTVYHLLPTASLAISAIYVIWVAFQGLAYHVVPGPIRIGQVTPAGNVLAYKVNGLAVYALTHFLFVLFSSLSPVLRFRIFPASFIATHFGSFLVAANAYGFILTAFAYLKARLRPTHPDDCKFSGSVFYDIFMGIEFNPRFGRRIVDVMGREAELGWDFKLFHNGRIGIIAWTLINISFAALQVEELGYLTNSMLLVGILQALYVIDFFYNEDWYLRTVDIAHDHFGYYLAWGDACWLPFMYTLQTQYLYHNPTSLSEGYFGLLFALGLSGYYIFRSANYQKDLVRTTNGNCKIWGRKPNLLRLQYRTTNGKIHDSVLLVDGLWGLARQSNYLGDLMLSLAECAACAPPFIDCWPIGNLYKVALPRSEVGLKDVLQPRGSLIAYFYIIFMTILLVHRVERSNERCFLKYGEGWKIYTSRVPYKIIPGIY